jgi:hypothetical protein
MILFLDFDGVLHRNISRPPEDFSCSPRLWQILRTCPNVEVVFSTSWREIYNFSELVGFVTTGGGEDLEHRFVGAIPSLVREAGANIAGRVYKREDECRLWLAGNGQQNRRWLALDDDAFWFEGPNLHLVNRKTGLTDADVAEIIKRLA